MFDVSVCTQSSKCCLGAAPIVTANSSQSPPARAFLAVGKACTDPPPISSLSGTASAPWVEASSISSAGGGNYQVTFPGFGASDPRCVTPCSATYSVCIWTFYADGTSSCDQETIDPATHCAAQPMGCPVCAGDDL